MTTSEPTRTLFAVLKYPTETATTASTVTVIGTIISHAPAYSTTTTFALTTKFIPPSACLTDVYDYGGQLEIALAASAECYPKNYTIWQTFSPAICPLNYTASLVTTQGSLREATCCPQLFSIQGASSYCIMAFNQPRTIGPGVVTLDPQSTITIPAKIPEYSTFNSTSTTLYSSYYSTTTVVGITLSVMAPPIIIQWATTDSAIVSLLLAQSASAASVASVASAASAASAVTTSHTVSSSSTAPSTSISTPAAKAHLSGGAIAGIVVGTVALLLLIAGALIFWRRRRNPAGFGLGRVGSRWRKSELADTSRAPVELPAEKEIKEMPVNEKPAELHGSPPPVYDIVLDHAEPTPATVRSPAEVPTAHDLLQA